jgi:hypothetical protein
VIAYDRIVNDPKGQANGGDSGNAQLRARLARDRAKGRKGRG